MQSPDFAQLGPSALEHRDLLFLFEHFPAEGVDAAEAARRVIEHPSTLESLLESRYVHDAMCDGGSQWLDVSPKLFFNVVLRHALLGRRDAIERRTIHYLANLLALFVRTERLYQVRDDDSASYEYLSDLVAEAADAGGERRFFVTTHIGNYGLYLAGLCGEWIEHRRRYRRRPLSLDYYCTMSRSHYASAASHPLSETYSLRPVFVQLARRFDYYRGGLEAIARRHLH